MDYITLNQFIQVLQEIAVKHGDEPIVSIGSGNGVVDGHSAPYMFTLGTGALQHRCVVPSQAVAVQQGKELDNLYLLFSCDIWKSRDSMRIVCVSDKLCHIGTAVALSIKDDSMEYDDRSLGTYAEVIEFWADWEKEELELIASKLKYGYIQVVSKGEIQ